MNDLRPLTIGELVDRSAGVWRANWVPLFRLFLGFELVQYVFAKLLEMLLTNVQASVGLKAMNPMEMLKHPPEFTPQQLAQLFGAVTLALVAGGLLTQIAGVAATHYVFPRVVGQGTPTLPSAFAVSMRKLGVTVATFVLSLGWTAIVGLGFTAPGIALITAGAFNASPLLVILGAVLFVVGGVVLVLWFILRFVLLSQVTAVEPLGAVGVFKRTGALSSGSVGPGFGGWVKGRLTVLVTIVLAILLLVNLLTSLPSGLVQLLWGNALDPGRDPVPQLIMVPLELAQVALGATVAPLYVVFQVLFYVDMRVRREGLDLTLKLGTEPPAA